MIKRTEFYEEIERIHQKMAEANEEKNKLIAKLEADGFDLNKEASFVVGESIDEVIQQYIDYGDYEREEIWTELVKQKLPKNCVECDRVGLREDCDLIFSGCANCGRHPKCKFNNL